MKPAALILILKVFVLSLLSTTGLRAETLTVFAAASLKNALEDIANTHDISVTFSFAGSGTLARQVAAGAPADVVVLAHKDWMDWLDQSIALTQRRDIASNRLVLIGPNGAAPIPDVTPEILKARLGAGRLAIGQTDSVPAGIYAKAWFKDIGLWDNLKSHLAETDSVRAALALVSRGEAPLGVVYRSDAIADISVQKLYTVPATNNIKIRYPAAATTQAGEAFVKYLSSGTAQTILAEHGFIPAVRVAE